MMRFGDKLRQYGAILRWFARDALWEFKWTVVAIIGGGFLSLLFQVQAIALAMYYSHALSRDRTISILGFGWSARTSVTLLVIAGLTVAGSMLIAAGVRYMSRRATLRLRAVYAKRCWIRVLRLLREIPYEAPGADALDQTSAMQLARTDSMLCSRFVAILTFALIAIINLVVTVGALIVVNPLLTLVIIALAGVSAAVFYRINVRAAHMSLEYEEAGPPARQETYDAIQQTGFLLDAGAIGNDDDRSWPAAEAFVDRYVQRLRCADESEFVGNIFLAVILGTMLIGLGINAVVHNRGWESTATYLVALPYALLAFRQLSRTVTMLNRFYPMAKRYRAFVMDRSGQRLASTEAPAYPLRLTARAQQYGAPLKTVEVGAGDRVGLIAPMGVSRYTLPYLVHALARTQQAPETDPWIAHTRFASQNVIVRDDTFAVLGWGADERASFNALADAARMSSIREQQWPDAADRPEFPARLHPALRFLAAVVEVARDASARCVFIDAASLIRLPDEGRTAVLERFAQVITVIVSDRDPSPIGTFDERVIGVLERNGLVALGDAAWLRTVEAELGGGNGVGGGRGEGDDADVLDDDMM
ncbi:MAG: ABC transporter ATP-binding protein [Phycisphaerales bacterium]|nr:ABC transporter ATP-binding protein [Phycisphaerales bacterium]